MEQQQLKLRLPIELAEWVKSQAADNRRSQSAEIVFRLEQARKLQAVA